MLALCFALSLSAFAGSHEPPPAQEGKQEPAPKPSSNRRRPPSPAVPADEPADKAVAPGDKHGPTAVRPGKETGKHGSEAETSATDASKPTRAATPSARVAARPGRKVPPAALAVHPNPSAADVRAALLESENARLRQQIAQAQGGSAGTVADPQAALQELKAGNQRFVAGTRVRTLLSTQDADLRVQLAKGQAPFAVIITCSDSRLADNLIFDQELGRLFTIREAGNCPDAQSLASVEYALEHLGCKVVVVMGHMGCGAVKAVSDAHGKPMPGNLWALQAGMTGLLESVPEDPNEDAAAHMAHLVEANAQRQAQVLLDRSDLVRETVAKGRVQVVSAVYDLATGKVVFLPPPAPGKPAPSPSHHAAARLPGTAPAAS